MPEAVGFFFKGIIPVIEPASLLVSTGYRSHERAPRWRVLMLAKRTARFPGKGFLVSPRSGFSRCRRHLYSGNGPFVSPVCFYIIHRRRFYSGDEPVVSPAYIISVVVVIPGMVRL